MTLEDQVSELTDKLKDQERELRLKERKLNKTKQQQRFGGNTGGKGLKDNMYSTTQ